MQLNAGSIRLASANTGPPHIDPSGGAAGVSKRRKLMAETEKPRLPRKETGLTATVGMRHGAFRTFHTQRNIAW